MKWKPLSRERADLLAAAIGPFACEAKKMFGYPAYFVNRNMWTGVHGDKIFIRLSPADRDKILDEHADAMSFEPMPGRPMKDYVELPGSLWSEPAVLNAWLKRSHAYTASLPPKAPKK